MLSKKSAGYQTNNLAQDSFKELRSVLLDEAKAMNEEGLQSLLAQSEQRDKAAALR